MIKCTKSDLKIDNIFSIKSSVETIFLSTEQEVICFDDHQVNFEFDKFYNKDDKKCFLIILNVEILPPDGNPGYKIMSTIHGYFTIDNNAEIDDNQIFDYHNTALAIIISYLRSHLRNITHEGIYGSYLLHSINIVDLLEQKNQEFLKEKDIHQKERKIKKNKNRG